MDNYTIQDITGSLIAFFLFSTILVAPGFVTAWAFDLLDFRARKMPGRLATALILSISIMPILTYLSWRLISFSATAGILAVFFAGFLWILVQEKKLSFGLKEPFTGRKRAILLVMAGGWVLLAILLLVDIQWGQRLYFTVVSYDMTTRASIIDAIARTGVPPINPSYYPGHPVTLTGLYYFWYILCGIVDKLGGTLVDARMALIASAAWCGLGAMALIGVYLGQRNVGDSRRALRLMLIGVTLLAVSGLDFIPSLSYMIASRVRIGASVLIGDVEGWNEQITAWAGAFLWVPHHVAAAIACLTGVLLFLWARSRPAKSRLAAALITGLGFASTLGLSTWIIMLFSAFWGIWFLKVFFGEKDRRWAVWFIFAGVAGILVALPVMQSLLTGSVSGTGGAPISFLVRRFGPIYIYILEAPVLLQNIVHFLVLPINYLFELGLFMLAGLFWWQTRDQRPRRKDFEVPEILLLIVTVLVTSFLKASVIPNNDLGWRGWLFGQFILLFWTADFLEPFLTQKAEALPAVGSQPARKIKQLLVTFFILGAITTFVDLFLLRSWPMLIDARVVGFPNDLSADTNLGRRTYDSRQAYDFVRNELPVDAIVENDPRIPLDRSSGMYRSRQAAIGVQTLYGVPESISAPMIAAVGEIFFHRSADWQAIDQTCNEYSIDYIVIDVRDPSWKPLTQPPIERLPLFQNEYYAVFSCGD